MNVFCRQTESKRTRRLTAGLTAALVAAVISSALASVPLGVRDDFDYTDTRARTTGVELDYVAGQLVFHLGTDSTALPVVAVGDNPRFAAGEVPDDEFLADTLPGVTLEVRAGTLYSVRLEHEAASLSDVIDAYLTRLAGLGFEATHAGDAGNVQVYEFDNGEGALRAVFTPTGEGGRAYITTL